MGYKKKNADLGELASEFEPAPLPVYSKHDLEEWGKWLDGFREEKQVKKLDRSGEMETLSIVNIQEAAVAFGALRKRMHAGVATYAVILKPTDFDSHDQPTKYERPTMMDRFEDKYEQYTKMKGRAEFAEKMRMKDLEAIAETIGHPDQNYDFEAPDQLPA